MTAIKTGNSILTDWLTAHWNRRVVEIEEESNQFPSFGQFVAFLTKEAKIACNPVTSLQGLKQGEVERAKSQRQQSFGVNTLMTSSDDKTNALLISVNRQGIHCINVRNS